MKEFLAVFLLLLATTSAHHDVHLLHADRFCANVTAEHNILLPSPLDCRIYYKCNNGMAIPKNCPDGLHWCQALTQCLLPAIANCTIGHMPVTYPPGKEPSTLPPLPTQKLTCSEEGALYPDPSDCARYYECKNHKPSKKHCPAKKVFSVLIGACVEADVAVCINDLKPKELCPVNGNRFVDPLDCNSYYECVNNSIETKECAPDMQYNQWFHLCASEELAHCQTYPTPKPTTMPPTTVKEPVPGQNLCPGDGFTLPNYQDCHSFWRCTGDTFVQDHCPPEFYYSCWDQKCMPMSSAQCEPQTGESCSMDGKKLPNPQDCHSYYVCKHGEVELEECSNGYEFNGWFSECVESDRAHCSVVTTTSTVSTTSASTPTPSGTNDICPYEGAKLPDLNDCHSYYVCVTETPQRRQCPLNEIYSCWDQTCLPSTAGVCITNPNQVGQPCSKDNSTLPDVDDCGKYYVCDNGSVQEKKCRSGLEYNKWYGKCVTPHLAHCQHPTTATGPTQTTGHESEPTGTTTVSSVTNSSDITQGPCIVDSSSLRPHPLCLGPGIQDMIYPEFTHCNQWMNCDCNRQLRTHTCVPINYHFNRETKKCENIKYCYSPRPGPDYTEKPGHTGTPSPNTEEPGHSGSPSPNTEEPGHSGSPGPNTSESTTNTPVPCLVDHSKPASPLCQGDNSSNYKYPSYRDCNAYQVCDCNKQLKKVTCVPPEFNFNCESKKCENITHCCAPGATTKEPEHSASPGPNTEEPGHSGSPGPNTEEPGHSGSPGPNTEEPGHSGSPDTEEPGHSGSPDTEEPGHSGSPGPNTEEPGHSGSTDTEKPGHSGSPDTEEPGHSGSPNTEEPGHSGSPNTEEPGHSGSPDTEEPGHSGSPNTEEPGHSGSPNTEEPGHSGSPDTEEPGHSGSPNTEEPGHSGSPNTEEPGHSGSPNTEEPGHSGSPDTEEPGHSGSPNTEEPGHSGSPNTEEPGHSGSPDTEEPGHSGSPNTEEPGHSGSPNTEEPGHSGSPDTEEPGHTGSPNTEEPGHSGSPNTEEPGHSGSPDTEEPGHSGSPNTEEPGHSGSPNTEEPGHSGSPDTEEPGHSGSPNTEEPGHSGSPNTKEPGHSGSPNTEEPGHSGSPDTEEPGHSGSPNTEEPGHSGSPNTEEPGHSGSPDTEEPGHSGSPDTEEPGHSGSPNTEEPGHSGSPDTEEPGHSGSPGPNTSESTTNTPVPCLVDHSKPASPLCQGDNSSNYKYPSYRDCNAYQVCDCNKQLQKVTCDPPEFNFNCESKKCENITHCCAPGATTKEPGHSASPGPNTEEPGHSGSPDTEEPGHSASPGPNTEEPGHSGSPDTEEPGHSASPGPNTEEPGHSGSPDTEEPGHSGSPNTEEPGHSGSPGPNTEEPGHSGSPGPNTEEPGHSGSPDTEEPGHSGSPGPNTEEPGHSGSPNTEEPGHSGSPGPNTEEPGHSGSPGPNTEEPGHSGSPGPNTEEPGHSGSPGPNTEEPGHSGSPGPNTEEPGHSGSPGPNTEEPGHSGSPNTEEPGHSGSPGPNTEEPGHSGSPGPNTEEPGHSGSPGPNTEEPGHTGSPGPNTEEPGHSGSPGPNTEEPGHSGSPVPNTEEPGHSGSPNTEEPGHSGSPGPNTEEPGHSGSPDTEEPGHSGSPGPNTEEPGHSGSPGPNTEEPGHSGSSGPSTEEPGHSGSPGPNTEEPDIPSYSPHTSESTTNTPVPCHVDHSKPASPLCQGDTSNFKYPAYKDCNAYQVCDCNKQLKKVTCDPPEFNFNCESKKCENITHCCAPGAPTISTTVSTTSSPTPTSSPELPTTCPLGLGGAKLPNPMDCKTYFTCDNNGEIVIRPCPAGEMYSCWNQRCESPQDSSCINNPNIAGQNCSKAGQLLPNVANCRGYYKCVNGKVQAELCESGQMYDAWLEICVKFNSSACSAFPTVTPPPVTGPTVPPTPGPDYYTCPFEGAMFPNLQDCNSYYECIGGVPESQNCLAGYVYSCWDQQCEPAVNGTCVNQPEQQGDKCSIDGVRVSRGDCTSYYECEDGKIVLHKCPKGQQFNAAYLKCYPSESAHCEGNTPLPTTLHPPTAITPQPGSDVCPIEGALLPNPLNCSTYYRCKNGEPTLERCVTGFEYSCWNQKCEPAGTAKCIADNPNQSNQTCTYNGQKTQNPEDCQTYYECKKKKVVLKHCPKKMSFNKWFGICLPENLAHCKATTVSPPVTHVTQPTPTMSPDYDICPINGGLIPHATDCRKYYQCVDHKPVERTCPSGQKYSCWDLGCKPAGSAECIDSGDQTGRHCALNSLHVPDPQNCADYYQCNNGKVERRYCAIGSQYNKWYHECAKPRYAHCTEVKITPSPTPTTTTTISPSSEYDLCPVDGAKLPDLVDCTKYYLCHNNTIDPQSCPDGQSYSCWDQKCEKDGVANCINYGVSQVGANCSIEGLRLSDVQNCSSYYECVNGTVTQEECPHGLQFNYKFQECYSPKKAHCQVTPTITPAPPANPTTVTPNPVNDVCPDEGAMLPNPLNCSTFYKCIKGNPVLQECASGLEYSCWDQRCEPADQANCISQPTTQKCSKNGARNADPADCHKFQECVDGTVQSKTCDFNWFYNKWFGFCVPIPDSAHCGPKITVTPKPPPKVTTVQPGNTDTCPTNGARIPDPKDCTQYYECVKGKPTIQKCPHGKKYSYSDEECKKDSEAQCINVGSPIGQTCKHEGLRVQNLQSCTSFYECIDGVIELQSCLPLFQYNRWYHSCKLVIIAHCQTYPTIPPPTTVAPAVTTKKYPAIFCSGDGQVPDIKDCNKYAVCDKNSVVLHNCRPGTNYDGFSQSCVATESAQCGGDIGHYVGKRCSKEGVTVPDPKDCQKYYHCKNGKIKKGNCGIFMQYDIWSGKCGVILLSRCILSLFI